jgi:hypothetical protein
MEGIHACPFNSVDPVHSGDGGLTVHADDPELNAKGHYISPKLAEQVLLHLMRTEYLRLQRRKCLSMDLLTLRVSHSLYMTCMT